MQMFVMAPTGEPAVSSATCFPSGLAPQSVTDCTQWAWPVQQSWSVEQPWPVEQQYLRFDHEAPQQLPMETIALQGGMESFLEHPTDSIEVTPLQLQMNAPAVSSLAGKEPTVSTLRRRAPVAGQAQAQLPSDYHEEVGDDADVESVKMSNELLKQLDSGAEAQWSVLARFQHLAFANQMSSRAAQLALENASTSNAALLASSFQGHVRRAAQSKHANYVVQKMVEVMSMARTEFIVQELMGFAHETACHRFG